jgi:hypothetical protein
MKRRTLTVTVDVEIPYDVDIYSLVVRSLSLASDARTIALRPVGAGAYLRPKPPEGRILRAEITTAVAS